MNGNKNRVASIRATDSGGNQMEILTEFDCRQRRQRSLSSATTDKAGYLIDASKGSDDWFAGKDTLGLEAACNAPLTKP